MTDIELEEICIRCHIKRGLHSGFGDDCPDFKGKFQSAASEREIVVPKEAFDELVNLAKIITDAHFAISAGAAAIQMAEKIKTLAKQKTNNALKSDSAALAKSKGCGNCGDEECVVRFKYGVCGSWIAASA